MQSETFNLEYIQNMSPDLRLRTVKAVLRASQSFIYSWSVVYDFSRLSAFITDPRAESWDFELPESNRLNMLRFFNRLKECANLAQIHEAQRYFGGFYRIFTRDDARNRARIVKLDLSLDDVNLIKQLLK